MNDQNSCTIELELEPGQYENTANKIKIHLINNSTKEINTETMYYQEFANTIFHRDKRKKEQKGEIFPNITGIVFNR